MERDVSLFLFLNNVLRVIATGYSDSSNTELLEVYNMLDESFSPPESEFGNIKKEILLELGKRYIEVLNQSSNYEKIRTGDTVWVIGNWNIEYEIEKGVITYFNLEKSISIYLPFGEEAYRWSAVGKVIFFDEKSAVESLRLLKSKKDR